MLGEMSTIEVFDALDVMVGRAWTLLVLLQVTCVKNGINCVSVPCVLLITPSLYGANIVEVRKRLGGNARVVSLLNSTNSCRDRISSFKIRVPTSWPFAVPPLVAGCGVILLVVLLLLSQMFTRPPLLPRSDLLVAPHPELPDLPRNATNRAEPGGEESEDGGGRRGGAGAKIEKKSEKVEAGSDRGRGLGEGGEVPGWLRDHFLPDPNTTAHLPQASSSCNLFGGRWVYDDAYPLWSGRHCPFAPAAQCEVLGRTDLLYSKLRWQPHGCALPRWSGAEVRETLRGKRVLFVGDSLGRSQWEALLCRLAEGVGHERMEEIGGAATGVAGYHFLDSDVRVEYIRAPWLVAEVGHQEQGQLHLRLEEVKAGWGREAHGADYVVLNLGHWMTDTKIKKQ